MRRTTTTMRGGLIALGIAVLVFSTLLLWRVAFQADGDILSYKQYTYTNVGATSTDGFGFSAAVIGDVNGDNIEDIAVTAIGDDDGTTNIGAVYILFMNTDGNVKTSVIGEDNGVSKNGYSKISYTSGGFDGEATHGCYSYAERWADAVGKIGDINGDGTPDLGVSTWTDCDGGALNGALWIIFLDSDGTVDRTVVGEDNGASTAGYTKISTTSGGHGIAASKIKGLGYSIEGVGDINGDGTPDIIAGAYTGHASTGATYTGTVFLFFMNPNGTINTSVTGDDGGSPASGYVMYANGSGGFNGTLNQYDKFGYSIASLGDVNGDGINDIAVATQSSSKIYVLFLDSDGTVKTSVAGEDSGATSYGYTMLSSPAYSDSGGLTSTISCYGQCGLSSLGDINGDRVADLAIGYNWDNDGGSRRGAVFLVMLNNDGTSQEEIKISDTAGGFSATFANNAYFGQYISTYDDLNNDGTSDLLITAQGQQRVYTLLLDGTEAPPDVTAPTPGNSGTIAKTGDTETTVTIGWTKATDDVSAQSALTYKVYYAADGTDLSSVANAEANGTLSQTTTDINSATISDLTGETDYEFQVVVSDGAGNKAAYTAVGAASGAIPDVTAPTPGDSGTITASDTTTESVSLLWTVATDDETAEGSLTYKVYYAAEGTDLDSVADAEANGTLAETVTGDNNYIVTGLASNTLYEFQLVVSDASSNKAVYTQAQLQTARLSSSSPTFPSNLSVQINEGASCTNSADVTVNISGDYVDKVVLADDDRFLGSFWEIFTGSPMNRAFTLVNPNGGDLIPGEEQSVYVIFRSWHGNKSFIHSDSIVYDPDNADCTYASADTTDTTTDETTTEDTTDTTTEDTADTTDTTTTDDGTADTTEDTTDTNDTTTDETATDDTTETTTEDTTETTTEDTTTVEQPIITTPYTLSPEQIAFVNGLVEKGQFIYIPGFLSRSNYYVVGNKYYPVDAEVLQTYLFTGIDLKAKKDNGAILRGKTNMYGYGMKYLPGLFVLQYNGAYYWFEDSGDPLRPIAHRFASREVVQSIFGRSWRKYLINTSKATLNGVQSGDWITSADDFSVDTLSLPTVRDIRRIELPR